jgi:hypothetical protein
LALSWLLVCDARLYVSGLRAAGVPILAEPDSHQSRLGLGVGVSPASAATTSSSGARV